MAGSPRWKVYAADRDYRASCKHVEEAACLVSFLGDGASIRDGHARIMWLEGSEDQPAADSYDHVTETVHARAGAYHPGAS